MRKMHGPMQETREWSCWVLNDEQVSRVDIDTFSPFNAKEQRVARSSAVGWVEERNPAYLG